ncbi:MAG: hypothetical protein KC643_33560 [Nitrospira sp.]|nr:hypothetical protein [Nitrospira sp.]
MRIPSQGGKGGVLCFALILSILGLYSPVLLAEENVLTAIKRKYATCVKKGELALYYDVEKDQAVFSETFAKEPFAISKSDDSEAFSQAMNSQARWHHRLTKPPQKEPSAVNATAADHTTPNKRSICPEKLVEFPDTKSMEQYRHCLLKGFRDGDPLPHRACLNAILSGGS